jgi:thiol-disulfide isomerase/thioredoxin
MKRIVAVVLMAFLAVALSPAQGKAPNFALKTAEGRVVELSKLQGKVVVVNFWATWCGPCRAEMPGMLEVYSAYKGKGVEFVGISVDEGGWKDVTPFVKRMSITYPVVLDDGAVAGAYGGVNAIPTTFIVDRKGNLVTKHVGYLSKEDFEKNIKAVL